MNEVERLRKAAGLTQQQLAQRSAVAQPNIAAYESGRRRASPTMLERLRRAAQPRPHELLRIHRDEIAAVARRHGMSDVRVFGSASRGTDHAGSDIDVLVTPPDDAGLLAIAAFAGELEDLLGVPVDVVTDRALRPGHPVLAEALPL